MKKTLAAILALTLVMSLFSFSAMAMRGELTIKEVKAYADPQGKKCVGSIPAYTSVLVNGVKSGVAQTYVNGKVVYVLASGLTGKGACNYIAGLKAGTRIYQRASSSSRSAKLKDNVKVYVCSIDEGWALIRSGKKGVYAFVPTKKLIGLTPAK